MSDLVLATNCYYNKYNKYRTMDTRLIMWMSDALVQGAISVSYKIERVFCRGVPLHILKSHTSTNPLNNDAFL
jgi:hypothetical protein